MKIPKHIFLIMKFTSTSRFLNDFTVNNYKPVIQAFKIYILFPTQKLNLKKNDFF